MIDPAADAGESACRVKRKTAPRGLFGANVS
jgi:hypothetical protein